MHTIGNNAKVKVGSEVFSEKDSFEDGYAYKGVIVAFTKSGKVKVKFEDGGETFVMTPESLFASEDEAYGRKAKSGKVSKRVEKDEPRKMQMFSAASVREVNERLKAVLTEFAKDNGLEYVANSGNFSDTAFNFKGTFRIKGEGGGVKLSASEQSILRLEGLEKAIENGIVVGSDSYKIVGYRARARKMPIVLSDGVRTRVCSVSFAKAHTAH